MARRRREFDEDFSNEENFGSFGRFGFNPDAIDELRIDDFDFGGGGGGGRQRPPTGGGRVVDPPIDNLPPPPPRPVLDPPPPPPPKEEIIPPPPIEEVRETITPIVGGCMDRKALNFNANATYDNGKCVYPKPSLPVVKDYDAPVSINVTVTNGPAMVQVDGKDVSNSPELLKFTEKGLLTPKIITVKKAGFTSNEEYRVSTVQRTINKPVKPIRPDLPLDTPDFLRGGRSETRGVLGRPTPQPRVGVQDGDNNLGNKQFFAGEGFGEFNINLREDSFRGNIAPSRTSGGNQFLNTRIGNRIPLQLGGFGNQSIRGNSFANIFPQAFINPLTGNDVNFGFTKPVIPTNVKPPTINYGSTSFSYYDLKIERKSSDGKWVEQPSSRGSGKITEIALRKKIISFGLKFNLTDNKEEKEIESNNKKLSTLYKIRLLGDVPADNVLAWRTNYGQVGFVLDDDDLVSFELEQQQTDDVPYIEFTGKNNVTDFTYSAVYSVQTDKLKEKEFLGVEQKIILQPGKNDISIVLTKNSIKEEPTSPTLRVDRSSAIFNVSNPKPIRIDYQSRFADYVTYSLGKVTRRIGTGGTVTLKESDFQAGLGQYTLYLQPVSERGGSGEVRKVVITVNSKAFIPGPDITHINYPQNIKGKDFAGFNVPFEISWQSINTNYVYIYVGKVTPKNYLGKYSPAGAAEFNVADIIKKSGNTLNSNRDITVMNLLLVPYNTEGDAVTAGKTEEINITFDKGDLKLRRANVVQDIYKVFRTQLDSSGFDEYTSPFLTHYLHLGDGNNKLIGTWGIDNTTFSQQYKDRDGNIRYREGDRAIVFKLYEPLPRTVSPNDKIWVSKIQSVPLIDQITLVDDTISVCTPLQPNFSVEINDDIGYQILDDLIASGSSTSTDVVNQFVSSSQLSLNNLDIEFVTQSTVVEETEGGGSYLKLSGTSEYNWKEFIKYSSAEERVRNFFYKVQLIESYNNKYTLLTSGSGTTEWTGSVSILNEANKQLVKSSELKNGFDAFEKWLYTSSSVSGLTYPGAGQNEVSSSTDSSVTNWFNSIVNDAGEYDEYNTSRLVYNLPKHITNDEKNTDFILFFDMVGQHFDILYTHINGINKSRVLENKKDVGIANDLIYHMLESLGWNADSGVQSQFLWEYAFGKHSDGTVVSEMSGKDRQQEVWRRILNNLPYLQKHKGTKRALSAALSCYGIPASLLTVMEFGGPKDPTQAATKKFTFEDRTASINVSGSSAIKIDWKQFSNDYSTDYPNCIELRLNTEQRQNQEIISGSQWSLHLLKDTGSMAHLELRVMSGSTLVSSSTDSGSFFNDEYTQIVVNKQTTNGDDVFTFYAKEGFNERIRTNVSGSLTVSGVSGWTSGSEIKVGGTNLTASIDEIRLWRTPLSESRIDNHTLLPDAIDGNHVSASTTDLILRHDFEYPKNRGIDTDIKNVALITTYGTGSDAVNFESIVSYPYNYTAYDRTVTADVPSSGVSVGNKIRFESQTKITDLSYRTRATKKSFDQAPLDSDRLGLFFSPMKEINMDILKSLGSFEIDNYIGSPNDEYSDEYKDLKTLRNYYFDRYTLNLHEYIQLVRYIDKSLFDVLESLVPARAKVSSGLLIEPHILERSKTKWTRPNGEKKDYASSINVDEDINLLGESNNYLTVITASNETTLSGDNIQYSSTIEAESDINLTSNTNYYQSSIDTESDINLQGTITRNSGSDMGGISISIDCGFTGSVLGEYEGGSFEQVGNDPLSIGVLGFGLYGSGSHAIRTRLDKDNNFVKERVKVFLINESYTVDVPENISADSSQGRQFVTQTKYRKKVSVLPFTGSDGLETNTPSGDNIVSATPLNGYFPSHYRNVGDLTTGLENSFFNGSKQTSATTLDGGSPVQTFTTNPNTLRVSDSGRGSGEPILEVD